MSNHNNNNNNQHNHNNQQSNNFNWKMWISLALYTLLGLAVGYAAAKGALYLYNKRGAAKVNTETQINKEAGVKEYDSNVVANFEGENKASLAFDVPENYKVEQGTGVKDKNYTIRDEKGNVVAYIYLSYEGGRGYTALDYIKNNINPSVKGGVSTGKEVTYGDKVWTRASNALTEWHLKPTKGGEWLIYVQNKIADHDMMRNVLESIDLK